MQHSSLISQNQNRNRQYLTYLDKAPKHKLNVRAIAKFGSKLMRQAKLHYHFFENHSLYKNALYLSFFALHLPYMSRQSSDLKRPINEQEAIAVFSLFERRITERVPVEYITQECYYSGRSFFVNQDVLVPRSLMSSQFNELLQKVAWNNHRVLDMCTGSGCIGITLALLNPDIKVDLVDISPAALRVAQINIQKYQLEARVRCIQSDLFENVEGRYDLIISNPPYVSEAEYQKQPQEVKNEPKIALTSGETGLDIVHKLLAQSKKHLNQEGVLLTEVGYEAAKAIKKYYPQVPFHWYKCRSWLGYDPLTDWFIPVIEWMIQWSSYLDSFFMCEAKHLP